MALKEFHKLLVAKAKELKSANVWTSTHITNIPVTRLYPFEISVPTELETPFPESQTDTTVDDDGEWVPQDVESVKLPKRAAARKAMTQLSE